MAKKVFPGGPGDLGERKSSPGNGNPSGSPGSPGNGDPGIPTLHKISRTQFLGQNLALVFVAASFDHSDFIYSILVMGNSAAL